MARPKKEKPVDPLQSHGNYQTTADELRQFIERAETLAAEKRDVAEQEKELFAEAKGRGYDTKVMKKVIAERKRSRSDIQEEEAILNLYRTVLGMDTGAEPDPYQGNDSAPDAGADDEAMV